jgi:alkylation response protein AidB-like acyl-CoA dehydrogenase
MIGHVGIVYRYLEEVRRWAQETKLADGRRVIDQQWVQLNLARVAGKCEYLTLRNWHTAWSMATGRLNPADASVTKVFSSEFYCEAYRLLLEVVGSPGCLKKGSFDGVLGGRVEIAYHFTLLLTFGAGTNEIQRDIIAMLGLGMPRGSRS